MYEGPTIYETNITNYYLLGIVILIVLAIIILMFISLSKIFKKADKNYITGFIPFYNILVLLEVCNLSKIHFFLLFIPIINIIPIIIISKSLAEMFNQKTSFIIGLIFLPLIYYPILAFSSSRYIGINNQKVEQIVLTDIVKEQVKTTDKVAVLKTDKNISVGTSTFNQTTNVDKEGELQIDTSILEINKSTPPEYIECPNCKNKVRKDAEVCFICGYKLQNQ